MPKTWKMLRRRKYSRQRRPFGTRHIQNQAKETHKEAMAALERLSALILHILGRLSL
jgi:hypothetical protein